MTELTKYVQNLSEEYHSEALKAMKYGRAVSAWCQLALFFWLRTNNIQHAMGIPETKWIKYPKTANKADYSEPRIIEGEEMLKTFRNFYGCKLGLSGCSDYESAREAFEQSMQSRDMLVHKMVFYSHFMIAKKREKQAASVEQLIAEQVDIIETYEMVISDAMEKVGSFLNAVESEMNSSKK